MDTEDEGEEFIFRTPIKSKNTDTKSERFTGELVERPATGKAEFSLGMEDEEEEEFIFSTPVKRQNTYTKGERLTGELVEQPGTGKTEFSLDAEDEGEEEFIFRTPIKRQSIYTKIKNDRAQETSTAGPHTHSPQDARNLQSTHSPRDMHNTPMDTQSTQLYLVGMQGRDSSRDIQEASAYGNIQVPCSSYPLERIKSFLRITKGQRAVQVEKHFPDLQLFQDTIKYFMRREGDDGPTFTNRETYRFKKC